MTPEERALHIQHITRELKKRIPYKKVNERELEKLFEKKRYQDIIFLIRKHMGIVCGLSVKCIVDTDNPYQYSAPARVQLPSFFHPYGSRRQKELKINMWFYKSHAQSYRPFIVAMAHELSHVLLYSLNNQFKTSEEATDICAILCGFGKYYELGHTTFRGTTKSELGYLSFEEVMYVSSVADGSNWEELYVPKKPNPSMGFLEKVLQKLQRIFS